MNTRAMPKQPTKALLPTLILLLLACLGLPSVEGAARTLTVPLTRATTPAAGDLGQPLISYYASVGVGTPPRQFNVQFDVATNELFLPHHTWNPFSRNLHYGRGFRCHQSSTCLKDSREFAAWYQGCQLSAKVYEDVVSLTGLYSINATGPTLATAVAFRQNFLGVWWASDGRFKALPVDGFFGLGPQQVAPTSVRNLLRSLQAAHLVDNLQFSLWFTPTLDSARGGELVLGGVDPARYQGQIFWHKPAASVAVSASWALSLAQVQLGASRISSCNGHCLAALSSGLSDTYGPRQDVQRIYNLLGTSHQPSGLEAIDCRRLADLPVLVFSLDGVGYQLLASNYVRRAAPDGPFKQHTCYVSILPSGPDQDQNTWTLGTNFLGAYYTVFDATYHQVGFAALAL